MPLKIFNQLKGNKCKVPGCRNNTTEFCFDHETEAIRQHYKWLSNKVQRMKEAKNANEMREILKEEYIK